MFSFGRKEKEELALIIDIGSASVGAAIVRILPNEKPSIIFVARDEMVFQEDLNIARFRAGMAHSLSNVLKVLLSHLPKIQEKSKEKSITRAYVTFASPWHASETRTISSEQEKSFRMTREILDRIVRREVESFERAGFATHIGNDLETIERHVMRIALNGYETNNPFGHEARSLHAGIFLSVISRATLDEVSRIIKSIFFVDNISFHSFPFVAFDVVRGFVDAPERFLVVDIGGEVTDVSVVSDRILLETTTFPVGKRTIIRAVSRSLKTTADEALSLIRLSSEKRLSNSIDGRVGKNLFDAGNTWVSSFEAALSQIATRIGIPSTLFLSADDDSLSYFSGLVKRESFTQFTMTDEMFSIFPLSPAALNEFCQFDRTSMRDPFLMMESIFASKMKTLV